MFNRVSELSRKTLTNGASQSAGDLDAARFEPLLDGSEAIRYVLTSTDGIEYTTDERTTTFEPGDGSQAYAAVSDQRLYYLLDDDPTDPEVSIALEDVTSVDLRDGLLNSTLVVQTIGDSVRFVPTDDETAKNAASYVSRIGTAWSDLDDALSDARDSIGPAARSVAAGEDARREIQRIRSRLSNARHCATRYDDAPTESMRAEIEPVASNLARLRAETRIDRVTERLAAARDARENDAYGDAFSSVVAANEALEDAEDLLADADAFEDAERFDEAEAELRSIGRALLADAEDTCHEAIDAADPAYAIADWNVALDRYRAALAADWDGEAGVDAEALQFQLAWVVGNLIDALAERASEREAVADDLDEDRDGVTDRYEDARADLVRARELAEEHPHADGDAYAGRLDDIDEKIERSQWQWGSAN